MPQLAVTLIEDTNKPAARMLSVHAGHITVMVAIFWNGTRHMYSNKGTAVSDTVTGTCMWYHVYRHGSTKFCIILHYKAASITRRM